jgi:hypothetical protein
MIRKFFGDGERDFALPAKMILELERTTGAGLGELFRKLTAGTFRFAEITETIRLAMIGGGTSPEDADRLVHTYVDPEGTPLLRAHILATDILSDRYIGPNDGATDEPA